MRSVTATAGAARGEAAEEVRLAPDLRLQVVKLLRVDRQIAICLGQQTQLVASRNPEDIEDLSGLGAWRQDVGGALVRLLLDELVPRESGVNGLSA